MNHTSAGQPPERDTLTRSAPNSYTLLVWNDSSDATFQFTRQDLSSDALSCPEATSTALGGPATTGSISTAAQVRCYTVTAGPGDRYFLQPRSPSLYVQNILIEDNGQAFSCIRACLTDAESTTRRYRFVLAAATAGTALPYQLDTWAVMIGGVLSPSCEKVPSVAYGLGPLTGTMTDEHPGRCLLTQVGTRDSYQVTTSNADGTAAQAGGYIVDPIDSVSTMYSLNGCGPCQPATNERVPTWVSAGGGVVDRAAFGAPSQLNGGDQLLLMRTTAVGVDVTM